MWNEKRARVGINGDFVARDVSFIEKLFLVFLVNDQRDAQILFYV